MSNAEQRPPLTPPVPPPAAPPTPPSTGTGPAQQGKEVAGTAAEQGKEVAGTAAEQGKQVAGTAAEQGKQVAGTAAEQGKEVVQTAAAGAQEVAGEAVREIKDVARTATDEARRLVDQTTGELKSQASTQTDRLAEGLRSVSSQLQKAASGQPLEAGPVRDLAKQAGSTVDDLARRLSDGGIEGVGQDLSSFARRRPGAFLAGAATLGFLAGRILRGAQAASQDSGSQQALPAAGRSTGYVAPPLPPTSTSAPHLEGATADATGVVVIDDGDATGIAPTTSGGLR